MLFLLSFVIFNDDLKKEFSFVKGILPGIFSGIVLYIIFYIGAFIIKVMPGGLENSVEAAFNKYSTHSLIIWLLLIVAIIPGEEIFWRGFVLKRLNHYFNPWFSNVFAALLCMVMMFQVATLQRLSVSLSLRSYGISCTPIAQAYSCYIYRI